MLTQLWIFKVVCIYFMLCWYICTQINKIAWDFFTKFATTFVFVQIQSHLYMVPLFTISLYECSDEYLSWASLDCSVTTTRVILMIILWVFLAQCLFCQKKKQKKNKGCRNHFLENSRKFLFSPVKTPKSLELQCKLAVWVGAGGMGKKTTLPEKA